MMSYNRKWKNSTYEP